MLLPKLSFWMTDLLPTTIVALLSICAVVVFWTAFTSTTPLKPKFADSPPDAPTSTPSTELLEVTAKLSA